MYEARNKSPLPHPYDGIQIFPDLSKYTLQLRRNLNPITKGLHNHKIVYKWRYPATLLISKNGATHIVSNLQKGMQLLHEWGIILEPPANITPPLPQRKTPQPCRHQGTKGYQSRITTWPWQADINNDKSPSLLTVHCWTLSSFKLLTVSPYSGLADFSLFIGLLTPHLFLYCPSYALQESFQWYTCVPIIFFCSCSYSDVLSFHQFLL